MLRIAVAGKVRHGGHGKPVGNFTPGWTRMNDQETIQDAPPATA
jgi:hypothetical protein